MQTREDITGELDVLYARRGADTLDGKRVDHTKITTLENQLTALDDAEAERVRRERSMADQEAKAEARRTVRQLSKLEDGRLLAWADAQVAAATLREAITRVIQTSDAEQIFYGELSGQSAPGLSESRNRISYRLANELRKAPGCRTRIGSAIEWKGAGGILSNDSDWRDAEAKQMEIPLKALMAELNIEDAK